MVQCDIALMEDVKYTKISSNQIAIWWIGQAGYIIKTSKNRVVVIDAYLSGSSRMIPPPLKPEKIDCDFYICTHNHGDHADAESIRKINRKHHMTFVGPKNVVKSFSELGIERERICEVNVGDSVDLQDIRISGTFCIPTDDTVLDSIGLLMQTENGITVYHSGDTGFHNFLFYLSKFPIDIMMVCINGGFGNMDVEEAVNLTRLLRPRVVIPNHYGMFADNTGDPLRFRNRLLATRAEAPCEILKIGEKYVYTC